MKKTKILFTGMFYAFILNIFLLSNVFGLNNWNIRSIETVGNTINTEVSLGLDSTNFASMVYVNSARNLRYAENVYESAWNKYTVDVLYNMYFPYISLAMDPNGFPHISYTSYYGMAPYGVNYLGWNGSFWLKREFALSPGSNSIAFDKKNNVPRIVTAYSNSLMYWTAPLVGGYVEKGTSNFVVQYASLAIDSNGYPHIAYYDYAKDDLKYATKTDGDWIIKTIDIEGGSNPSISLDRRGKPHIGYTTKSGKVKYAGYHASWVIRTLDSTNNAFASLDIDPVKQLPRVAYYNRSERSLNQVTVISMYPFKINKEVIENGVSIGNRISLKIDKRKRSHIGYCIYDSSGSIIRYAVR